MAKPLSKKQIVRRAWWAGARAVLRRRAIEWRHHLQVWRPTDARRELADRKFHSTVIQFWKMASGKRKPSPHAREITYSLLRYINRVDDLLDRQDKSDFVNDILSYKKDALAQKYIGSFVQQVKKGPYTPREKREMLKSVITFRRSVQKALASFESIEDPNTHDILRMRQSTTGAVGTLLFHLLNITHSVPLQHRALIEKSFTNSFLVMQIVDDVEDYREDTAARVPNILESVLRCHPTEHAHITPSTHISFSWLQRNAPLTYSRLSLLAQEYMGTMPIQTDNLRVAEAMARLYWKRKAA